MVEIEGGGLLRSVCNEILFFLFFDSYIVLHFYIYFRKYCDQYPVLGAGFDASAYEG